jgi:hypothetical protein
MKKVVLIIPWDGFESYLPFWLKILIKRKVDSFCYSHSNVRETSYDNDKQYKTYLHMLCTFEPLVDYFSIISSATYSEFPCSILDFDDIL